MDLRKRPFETRTIVVTLREKKRMSLSPDDILCHPIAAAIVEKISLERNVIIWGPSGGGKSMFVNAYMDKHVSIRGSTRKLLDSSTTPSDLIEEDQSVREGSYGFVMVDGISWTKSSIRFFFQKVPSRTKIVLVLPTPPKGAQEYSCFPNVFVPASIHPTDTYAFLARTTNLPYFPHGNPRAFYDDYLRTGGILARLLSRYTHGCAFMDTAVQASNVWTLKTLEESVQLVSRLPSSKDIDFFELCGGDMRLLAEALETRSFMDVQYVDIYGDENARKGMTHLLIGAEVFRQLRHGFL
jgi:hypothetical protein